MHDNVFQAFLLTMLAGLSTGIGSCIALLSRRTGRRFLSVSLGFSAGVMIYVSMAEILPHAQETLAASLGMKPGSTAAVFAFFAGMLVIAVIDRMIPEEENPHEVKHTAEERQMTAPDRMKRVGIMTAIAIAVHNFPEGLAAFVSALQEPGLALPVVAAIAIHNIPEGIAVSVPVYQATGSKRRAFFCSFLSGLAEPAGALLGWTALRPFMNPAVSGLLSAGVAGIMVFISVDELLPAARAYGEHHLSIYGMISGMAFMAVILLLFL